MAVFSKILKTLGEIKMRGNFVALNLHIFRPIIKHLPDKIPELLLEREVGHES